MQNKNYPTWVELDKAALNYNLDQLALMTGPAKKLGLVVKGNAYGHGLKEYALVAAAHPKVNVFFTGYVEEALLLRQLGVKQRICSLIPVDDFLWDEAIVNDIELVCPDDSYLERFATVARRVGKPARLHIKIDTGLARLGIMPDQVASFLDLFSSYKAHLELVGIMTHFANVVSDDIAQAGEQRVLFDKLRDAFFAHGLVEMHACASGSICMMEQDALVRVGTSCYGYWKSPAQKMRITSLFPEAALRPVMSWKTRVMQLKIVPSGTPIGYGHTFIAPNRMVLATIPVGYADGYPRELSNKGFVMVRGELVPVIGRISMNLMTIDVTRFQGAVAVGDEVQLLGTSEGITADDLARETDTINLAILSHVRASIPRILV